MIRFTTKTPFLAISLLLVFSALNAQSVAERLIVPSNGEELVEKYGTFERAVHEMSRDEWEVFRSWEGYDESRVRSIRAAAKEKYRKEHPGAGSAVKMMPPGGCDCWVEPDASYTTIGTNDWDFTGGAGADVDCSVGPINLGISW